MLVSPRNPLNIGAAARAMANFGFRRLSIVAPFAVNWMEAKSAVGAPDLLRDAAIYDTMGEALAGATLVLGTGSLDRRRPVQKLMGLPEAAALIRATIGGWPGAGLDANQGALETAVDGFGADSLGGRLLERPHDDGEPRVALVFGSEKHGLTSEELSWCHAMVTIETADVQPSMNLGQAVAVCLYEVSRTGSEGPAEVQTGWDSRPAAPAAPGTRGRAGQPVSEQLDRLAGLIEETMDQVHYTTRGERSANGEALRVLLRRLMPNDADLRRMMGLFRRILWQLGNPARKL